jgi:hypothetical protein
LTAFYKREGEIFPKTAIELLTMEFLFFYFVREEDRKWVIALSKTGGNKEKTAVWQNSGVS